MMNILLSISSVFVDALAYSADSAKQYKDLTTEKWLRGSQISIIICTIPIALIILILIAYKVVSIFCKEKHEQILAEMGFSRRISTLSTTSIVSSSSSSSSTRRYSPEKRKGKRKQGSKDLRKHHPRSVNVPRNVHRHLSLSRSSTSETMPLSMMELETIFEDPVSDETEKDISSNNSTTVFVM